MENKITYIELNKAEYEEAHKKNEYIYDVKSKYLSYICSEYTNSKEINEILTEYNVLENYEVIVFGEGTPYGEGGLIDTLLAPEMNIYAFVFKRDLMVKTGCFNEKLTTGTNYEFICRMASLRKVFFVNCEKQEKNNVDTEKEIDIPANTEEYVKTVSYICRRYLYTLDNLSSARVLDNLMEHMKNQGLENIFVQGINQFLVDNNQYFEIKANTDAVLIISGGKGCYGIAKRFGDEIAKELINYGQAVISTDGTYGEYDYEKIDREKSIKAVIGFQAMSIIKGYFDIWNCKVLQVWFDNPMFFDKIFNNVNTNSYLLCQDGYYACDARKYHNIENAIHFPLAGSNREICDNISKEYDIVFVGSYWHPEKIADIYDEEFYKYMILNPKKTFTDALKDCLGEREIILSDEELKNTMYSLNRVCWNVKYYYRKMIIDTLLKDGFDVHVYGDTWKDYENGYGKKPIIHSEIDAANVMKEYEKAKIALNIMSWHKDGMTERIADIMLSGAVCLTDETKYLRENFDDGKEIVLFELDKLNELKDKVDKILKDEEYRKAIAKAAYEKASREHTWKNRTKDIIELINK